jgi:hypothetical protein
MTGVNSSPLDTNTARTARGHAARRCLKHVTCRNSLTALSSEIRLCLPVLKGCANPQRRASSARAICTADGNRRKTLAVSLNAPNSGTWFGG